MFPQKLKDYLLIALSGTPEVLEGLLANLPPESLLWDMRPDPARFTLREIIAHLADWETIHFERLNRILREDTPFIQDIDEGATAVRNSYASSDEMEQLMRFRTGRATNLEFLSSLTNDEWLRAGNREAIGLMTIEACVALMLAHDGYHTGQTAEWLLE